MPEKAQAMKEKYGLDADVYDDHRKILDRDDIDLVVNSTYSHMHAPVSIDLLEHGFNVREDWVLADRDSERHNFQKFRLPEEMPTAFVCNCDIIASWVIRELEQAGYRVPEDVSIVGFDDFLYPGLCNVPMTTYAVNMTKMVKLLIRKMTGGETSEGMHLIEGRFIERKSVRAI